MLYLSLPTFLGWKVDTYTKGMGDGRRIRQRSQFTQLQRMAGLTDPISTNVKQRKVACCKATFSKSNEYFHVPCQAFALPQQIRIKTVDVVSLASHFRSKRKLYLL